MDFLDEVVPCVRQAIRDGHYDLKGHEFDCHSLKADIEGRPFSLIPVIEHRSPVEKRLFDGDVRLLAHEMAKAGAHALSVVCERNLFCGRMEDLAHAKAQGLPLLYKDFVVDPIQIDAAKGNGADAILLIKSLFDKKHTSFSLEEAIQYCHDCGLETLLEVFTLKEFNEGKDTESDLIGINNRNLKTLTVDLSMTSKILKRSSPDRPVISESGVRTRADMLHLQATGAKAVLVGTSILKSQNPSFMIRELLGEPT
ncbi:indole-3-glycerol-phosphate synthase [Candidatus Acetothermia bacterium]|nr:indole-3-glycerol-phosphate synthase [Candidatus Acetothermia bacterium]MBI3642934.1 indole-3-glycerol-phosphate synthase [Candidatus Acetothermia bacterium]